MAEPSRQRDYAVLIERTVDTDIGDMAFVWLGVYSGRDARAARRSARGAYNLPMGTELVAIPTSRWKASS